MRGLLFAALLFSPADFTVCAPHDNGPIIKQTPPLPFQRQPDFAAVTEYPRTAFFDGMPPPRFRGPSEMRVAFGELQRCGRPNMPGHPNARFGACIRSGVTYLPNPCDYPNETFAKFTCHEIAHTRGWPADHGA